MHRRNDYNSHIYVDFNWIKLQKAHCFIIHAIVLIVELEIKAAVVMVSSWVSLGMSCDLLHAVLQCLMQPRLNYRGNTELFWILYYVFTFAWQMLHL